MTQTNWDLIRDAASGSTTSRASLEAHASELRGGKGEPRFVRLSGVPIIDARGRFRGFRGTGRDITVERTALLKISRDELYALMRRSPEIGHKFSWALLTTLSRRLRQSSESIAMSRSSSGYRVPTA